MQMRQSMEKKPTPHLNAGHACMTYMPCPCHTSSIEPMLESPRHTHLLRLQCWVLRHGRLPAHVPRVQNDLQASRCSTCFRPHLQASEHSTWLLTEWRASWPEPRHARLAGKAGLHHFSACNPNPDPTCGLPPGLLGGTLNRNMTAPGQWLASMGVTSTCRQQHAHVHR